MIVLSVIDFFLYNCDDETILLGLKKAILGHYRGSQLRLDFWAFFHVARNRRLAVWRFSLSSIKANKRKQQSVPFKKMELRQ